MGSGRVGDLPNARSPLQCECQSTAQGSLCVVLYCTLESFVDYFFFSEMRIFHFDFLGLCSKDFGVIQTEIGKQTDPS